MKQTHDPTFFIITYVRLLALMVISVLMTVFMPFYVAQNADLQLFFTNQLVNMGILYALIVGFLMSITLTRKQALEESVSLELNKIRRIYHLAFHIQRAEPRLHAWYEGLLDALREYLGIFCKKSFAEYEEGNRIFRKKADCIRRKTSRRYVGTGWLQPSFDLSSRSASMRPATEGGARTAPMHAIG